MSDGHCFISYSNRDAGDFGPQLSLELEGGHPFVETWYDKRDIPAGQKWDGVVSEAIGKCKCFLFVVTRDSVTEDSICMRELSLALSYKKPIFPICLQSDVEFPWRVRDFQRIDLCGNRKQGMAQLRLAIQRLDSLEGQLDFLKDRLAAAERDFNNATEEVEKRRAENDVEELKAEIRRQEAIAANPKAAQEQTQKNIETGLERERKPEKPIASSAQSTKFINPPPGIAPNYFQDRLIETKQAVDFINDDAQRLMTIVGRGGVGKTAMVCRLLKELESGQLPDGLGAMKIEGIVYLSESGSHRVTFANIFYDLCKLLPAEAANELDAIYKNPSGSTESKMCAVLEKFAGGRVVLLLDNFEPLVDSETFAIRDAELDEALRAFLNGTHTAVNIVITTRIAPKALNLIQPGRQRVLTLDEGLDSPYAENILREMDVDGRIGLQSASDALLGRARERTRGYPRALEALFAILASDRYTTLAELLAMPTPVNVVEALVGEAFNRLDVNAKKVMQALAVYNRPVAPAAVDYLLAPHIPAIDSAPILQRLANMHFARKESGRFYLHPVDREFAFGLIGDGTLGNGKLADRESGIDQPGPQFTNVPTTDSQFTQHDLTTRAADYFAQARKPRAEWKKLEDLSAQLAEFDLRCATGGYDTAASVLTDINGEYLLLWGHYRLTIQMYEKLQGKIKDLTLARISIGNLGRALSLTGRVKEAISNYERALEMAREAKNLQAEGAWLGNLGIAYTDLGDAHKAIEFLEQALVIAQEIGDRRGESGRLGSLGNIYFHILGKTVRSVNYYKQALVIDREIKDRSGECADLDNYGYALTDLNDFNNAIDKFSSAILIADEINKPQTQNIARCGLAQAYLFQNDLVNARATIEAALQYDVPRHNANASALHGIITLRQGDASAARGAFLRAIGQADEILSKTAEYYEALDAKGLALSGLLVIGNSGLVNEAVETFRKARKIAPHAGIVKSVLRLFDELAQCDPHGLLKDIRPAAAGVATSAKSG